MKKYDARAIRYALLSSHYKQQLNFTIQGLKAAKSSVDRIKNFVANLKLIKAKKNNKEVTKILTKAKKDFEKSLDDDLNMPKALATIFILIRKINKLEISKKDAQNTIKLMEDFDKVLGILNSQKPEITKEIKQLIKEREKARKAKDFKKADEIRKMLEKKGILLEDTIQGPKIR